MSTCLQQGRKSQREGWCGLKPGPGPPWRRHSHCPTDAGARSWSLDDRTMNFASRFCIVTLLGCVTSVGRSVYWHYCSASHPWVVLYIDIIAVRHIRGSFCILTLLQCVTSVGRSVYWDYYSASHPWVVPVRWCWGVRLVKNCWGSILLGSGFFLSFLSLVFMNIAFCDYSGGECVLVGGGGGEGRNASGWFSRSMTGCACVCNVYAEWREERCGDDCGIHDTPCCPVLVLNLICVSRCHYRLMWYRKYPRMVRWGSMYLG